MLTVYLSDNLPVLRSTLSGSVDLTYIDPPFNTGHAQRRTRLRKRLFEDTHDSLGVLATRNLGNDATKASVEVNLRGHDVRDDATCAVEHRHGRLVA